MIYMGLLLTGLFGVLTLSLTGLRGGRGGHGRRGRARVKGKRGSSGLAGLTPLEALVGLLAPLPLFSLCLGAGATGLLVQAALRHPLWVALVAVLGGLVLWKLVIEPLELLLLRFASEPAQNLEGVRATEATAQSRFDAQGQGIVTVVVDGQLRRILATLIDGDPSTIHIGQQLVVIDVDTQRNRCQVAPF